MRTTLHLAAAAALAGLVALACSEGVAPSSDQTQALAAEQEQLGAMVDSDFGATGATPTASLDAASSSAASFSVNGTHADTAPSFWGRLRVVPGGPQPVYHRDVTIANDTATVEHDVSFAGVFLVDTSADWVLNPSSKPLAARTTQRALLDRARGMASARRGTHLSPQDSTVVESSRQTVGG